MEYNKSKLFVNYICDYLLFIKIKTDDDFTSLSWRYSFEIIINSELDIGIIATCQYILKLVFQLELDALLSSLGPTLNGLQYVDLLNDISDLHDVHLSQIGTVGL